jgi:hypothetical protein
MDSYLFLTKIKIYEWLNKNIDTIILENIIYINYLFKLKNKSCSFNIP